MVEFFHNAKKAQLEPETRYKRMHVPLEGRNPRGLAGGEDQCSYSYISFRAPLWTPHTHHTTHSAGLQPIRKTERKRIIMVI